MSVEQQPSECDYKVLKSKLIDALAEADKCDSLIAVYIQTALAMIDESLP